MNARMRATAAVALAALALMLTACSGGGGGGAGSGSSGSGSSGSGSSGSGSSGSGSSGSGSGSSGSGSSATTYSGSFIDAPVQGLSWNASPSSLSGTTDANGTFSFKAGDTVTFALNVGSSSLVNIGSLQPAAPASGSAELFVLSLANGLQVSQVLQSLNHGQVDAIDVGGLTLPARDVTSLNDYIVSGGAVLPASAANALQMLSDVQSDSNASSAGFSFVDQGGTSASAAMTALKVTLGALPASSATDLAAMLSGNVIFYQGIDTPLSGISNFNFDIGYFEANGSAALISSSPSQGQFGVGSGSFTAGGNVLTLNSTTNGASVTDTYTLSYADARQGLASVHSSDGSNGVGSFVFLTPLTPAQVAGRTLNLSGSIGSCGIASLQIVVAVTGTTYMANCQGQAAGSAGSGTIMATTGPTVPGVLTLQDNNTGNAIYLGLIAGGTVASGSVAIVSTQINGIFSLTS
jgi:hypothetical protein